MFAENSAMYASSSPANIIEAMLFSGGIWLMVTPGGAAKPIAPAWLRPASAP